MAEKKRKRRWMQFSLRTLLTLMLVVAAFFAGRMPVQRELERLEGAVEEAKKHQERAMKAEQVAVEARYLAERERKRAEEERNRAAEAIRRLDANLATQEDGGISSRPSPETEEEGEMANQIMAIAPYWADELGTWVFDDPSVDLQQEPFVSGVPEMIDHLVADIPDAKKGFRMLFSAAPFPGYQRKLTRQREEFGGWWYASDDPPMEGWLCPALFLYFDVAPPEVYVKAEAK